MLVYGLVPVGLIGVLGRKGIQANVYTAFDPALKAILGTGLGTVIVIMVVVSLVFSANVAALDSSRAFWQMSRDRLTVTWLGRLNTRGVPATSLACIVVVEGIVMWALGSPRYILAAGNLGYILCHVCALVAFILPRRDRPAAERPVRLRPAWIGIAAFLAAVNVVLIVIGGPQFGWQSLIIGAGILLVAVPLYLFRTVVQERGSTMSAVK